MYNFQFPFREMLLSLKYELTRWLRVLKNFAESVREKTIFVCFKIKAG